MNRIFHAALEVHPSQRAGVIAAESNGDAELEAEVQLLLKADSEAGSYLDSPLLPHDPFISTASPLSPGDTLCGRFRIVREIAEGGMGHIFEAFDSELAVRIALKVVRAEIASDPEAISRFRREVRLARSITHPNICRTFDIERETRLCNGQRSELIFLTMEFLDGETLATRLKRDGPLSPGVALDVARQIAAALDAAHVLGIVHRDMKPANIMLVPAESPPRAQPRIVVTDFGLARLDPLRLATGLSSFSHSGQLIGTLSYMAPEQLEGGTVSPTTDIYAFGLILFEMLTGRRAFPASNLLGGIAERLRGSLSPLESLGDNVPAPWHRTILACLQVDPSARPRDASAVLGMLEDPARRILPRRPSPTLASRRHTSGVALLMTSVLIALALLLAGLRLYRSRADSRVVPGALVYLTQVKNETGEKSLDSISQLIQSGLAQSVQVNLLDRDRIGDILQQMTRSPDAAIDAPTAREIAMRSGAARVIFATVSGARGRYSLDVDIQQPDYTPARYRQHWTRNFFWQSSPSTGNSSAIPADLLTQVRSASNWIRHEVGESANDIARLDTPPEDVTTSNWDALEDYMSAQALLSKGDKDAALLRLQEAVRADPGFARAYADLADNLVSIGRFEEGYAAYREALGADSGLRLSRRERDFIRGSYASDTRDFKTALAAFRDYSSFYENDFNAWFYQSYPLDMLDRPEEAIPPLNRAEALSPKEHAAAGQLTYNYFLLGDYAAAKKEIQTITASGSQDSALYFKGIDEFLEGQYSAANYSFSRLQQSASPVYRNFGYALLARLLAEQGRPTEALAVLAGGMDALGSLLNSSEKGRIKIDQAYIACRLGNFDECFADLNAAFALDKSPDAMYWMSMIAGSSLPRLAPAGRNRAKELLLAMQQALPQNADRDLDVIDALAGQLLHGELLLAQDEPRAALLAFRKADTLDAPLYARDYLARGLLAAAVAEPNAPHALALRREALAAYGRAALRPAAIWRQAWDYPPGFLADQMASYLSLAASLHRADAQTQQVENAWARLRKNAQPVALPVAGDAKSHNASPS